jgi:hypothetical protein
MTEPPNNVSSPGIDRRTFWLSIVASLVASILFAIFFQPITTGISNAIVNIIGTFYTGYIDSLYDQAAQSPADFVAYLTFLFVVMMPPMAVIMFTPSRFLATHIADNGRISRRGHLMIIVFLSLLSVVILLIITSGPLVAIAANANFQRQLMALSPVILQQERNDLLRNWAMMKSKADYDKIMEEVKNLATKYHSKLPNV